MWLLSSRGTWQLSGGELWASTGECIEEELGYPEVTDNLLLQLICQLNYYDEDMKFHADNYRELREEILENLIWIAKCFHSR